MSSALVFLPRRRSTISGGFFAPADLCDLALIRALETLIGDLVSEYGKRDASSPPVFQRVNIRSLIRKVEILFALFKYLGEGDFFLRMVPSATTCFKELYIVIHRAKILLDFCLQSSRIWLLLQNPEISGHFHDINVEIATILDVFPLLELDLARDVREQVELLHQHCRKSKIFVEPRDEAFRLRIFAFLKEFDKGRTPDQSELRSVFFHRLKINDAMAFGAEIEFLDFKIYNEDDDADPFFLRSVIALVRYCRFALLGCLKTGEEKNKGKISFLVILESELSIPKDFCCPISLDLIRDPVITSSGQTYDRASITQWIDEDNCTCPNSGQMLSHSPLMPNRALRNLIAQWCMVQGIPYDSPDIY